MITIIQNMVAKQNTKPTRMPIHMKFTLLWSKIKN